jgi:hypothetical protein
MTVAGGDESTIATINTVSRDGGADPVPANNPPTISGTPPTSVEQGTTYSFTPTASDAEGNTLSFTVTGTLSGTPSNEDAGTYSDITITVSDGEFSASLTAFSITVNAVNTNTAPEISGAPASSVDAGNEYSFTPTASDAEGNTLSFTVVNQPPWTSFDASTGTLSGTPSNEDAGTYSDITITVSDGEFSASLTAFSITVNAVITNAPPQISGTPATSINANNSYSFTPDATDPDGDNLTFSLSGQPSWASFDTSTGELSGTPNDAHVGVYSNIVISVSDGQETVSLASFSISVEAISLGSATLSWERGRLRSDRSRRLQAVLGHITRDLSKLGDDRQSDGNDLHRRKSRAGNLRIRRHLVQYVRCRERYSGAATKVIQ